MILRSYKKNVAEGLGFVIFSIIFGIIMRGVYFFSIPNPAIYTDGLPGGYLWNLVSPLFSNPIISLLGSTVCVVLIIIILAHINTKYVLIRRKTSLHIAFCILLFSCHPGMIFMNANYISAIFVLAAISRMFGSYSTNRKSKSALEVSFIIALGSMFNLGLILFFPVFWIGLALMRSFGFRAFFASLFSIFCVYLPAYTYFLFTNQVELFLSPFELVNANTLSQLPILGFEYPDWAIVGFTFFLIVTILVYNYMINYKDKIRVRALVSSLNLIVVFSFIVLLFVNINIGNALYILLAVGTLLLTHFFALAEERWIAYLFYLSIIIYLGSISLTFRPML